MQIETLNPNPPRDPSRKPTITEQQEEFGRQLDDATKEIDDAPARPEQTAPDQAVNDGQEPVPDGADRAIEPTAGEQPAMPVQPANLPAETSFEQTVASWTAQDATVEATPHPIVAPEPTTPSTVEPPTPSTVEPPTPSTVEPTVPAVAGSDAANDRPNEPILASAPAAPAANPIASSANGIEVSYNGAPPLAPEAIDKATGGRRAELNQLLERHLATRPGLGAQVSADAPGLAQASPSGALGVAPGQSKLDKSAKGIGLQALLDGATAGHTTKPAPSTAAAPATAAPATQQIAEPIVDIPTNVVPTAGTQAGTAQAAATVMAPQQAAAAQPVAHQVAVQIARASEQGVDRFRIQLNPPELGRVDVRLELSHDGRVQVVISAERSETLDLLRRDVAALERALAEAGLETDADSLRFSERGDQGDDGDLADAPEDGIDDDPDRAGGPGEMPSGAWIAADGALDIRV